MNKNKTIAVLRGGLSSEQEVSNKSAAYVLKALKALGYNALDVKVDENFLSWALENKNCIDVFFNALHGRWGEDGKIQGILEFLRIPYTHSGVTASALGMDKELSKKIFENAGITVPKGKVVSKREVLRKDFFKRPFVIKPISEGSSVGVNIVRKNTLIKNILKKTNEKFFLIEEYIDGIDCTVALMNGKVLGLLEIIPSESFYNYSAKYKNKETIYRYPKKIDPKVIKKIFKFAKLANKVIKSTSITRVDFRVNNQKEENGIYVLEINTQPGLTRSSLVPKIAKQSGVSFENLIDWIVKDAKNNKI
ncbi:MAG: D-alanine--D-alanine ligase B [Alphaproteobacteria bacterium MarineAlpha9_Bin4]|nr:MAG: D-alanine--D-alanine ligase B [Alphaproteobacteria bacterium MarineAlpha9_Bin4]